MARIAITGAGIAGLTAAWQLRQLGHEVEVFEASHRPGGKLRTEREGPYLIDAGPDSLLSSKPAALELARELGLGERIVPTLHEGGGTYILRGGRLTPLPEGMTLLVPADIQAIARTPLLSTRGKARMLLDLAIPRRRDEEDEAVGAFVRRRLGREAFERLAEPLLSGIYAGDADRLSLLATFPRLREIERQHGSVIRGALAQRRQARSAPPRPGTRLTPFVSFTGGMGELVDALVAAIGTERLRLGTPVVALAADADGATVTTAHGPQRFDGVVLALPAWSAAPLLREVSPELTIELASIEYVSSATVSLAFDAADVGPPAGRGFVVPRAERRRITAVTWTSAKFPGRAPDGAALLRAFVGRAGDESALALEDDAIVALVREELRDILGITAEPRLARVYRWERALPQYTLGHPERVRRVEQAAAAVPWLAITGAALRGVGIPDLVRDAREQARSLSERLAAHAEPSRSAIASSSTH